MLDGRTLEMHIPKSNVLIRRQFLTTRFYAISLLDKRRARYQGLYVLVQETSLTWIITLCRFFTNHSYQLSLSCRRTVHPLLQSY